MPRCRVAHISDLHCDGTPEWRKNFGKIIDCLTEERPNVLVITGDCVDHPREDLFNIFADAVHELCGGLGGEKDGGFYLLTIPGNHDRFRYGNKVFPVEWNPRNRRRTYFEAFLPSLLHPRTPHGPELSLHAVMEGIFRKYDLAIFPIDSTQPKWPIACAQGRVDDPHGELARTEKLFVKWAGSKERYNSCLKLVLLHHHVMPLPANKADEFLEPLNIIQNPFQFMDAVAEHRIDLVLHGHRHVSGVTQIQMLSHSHRTVTVSACASSCKTNLGSRSREIKIVDFTESGATKILAFIASDATPSFKKSPDEIDVTTYPDRREARSRDEGLYESKFTNVVNRVAKKTTILKIELNNMCEIRTSFSGIKWHPHASTFEIHERITSEVGRVVRVQTSLSQSRMMRKGKWLTRAQVTGGLASPEVDERVDIVVKPNQALSYGAPAYCHVRSMLHNGYALTTTEHEECYPIDSEKEEACRIRVRYPTDEAEIIVKFPPGDYFPDPESFHVNARAVIPGDEKENPFDVLANRFEPHKEETQFLIDNGALQVRPEIYEAALLVRYPQPGIEYTLRWSVVDDQHRSPEDEIGLERAKELSKRFSDARNEEKRLFYRLVAEQLGKIFDPEKFDFVLLGMDRRDRILRVVEGPSQYFGTNIHVGRGVAGTAFKLRKAESYLKGGSNTYMEPFFLRFDPEAILSLPLLFPAISLGHSAGNGRDQPFGVLSILTKEKGSKLTEFILKGKEVASSRGQGSLNGDRGEEAVVFGSLYKVLQAPFLKCFTAL